MNEKNDEERVMQLENSEEKIITEKHGRNKKTTLLIETLVFVVLALIFIVIFLLLSKSATGENGGKQKSVNSDDKLSFNYMVMNKDNIDLDENKKLVLEYFDNTYLHFDKDISLTTNKYPTLFKGMKVTIVGEIKWLLESNDDSYSAIMEISNSSEMWQGAADGKFVYITGEQQKRRLSEKDIITIYGTYETSILNHYTGSGDYIAKINVLNWVLNENKFDNDQLREIARAIFGENVKFGKVDGCAYNPYCETYPFDENNEVAGLKVKLEDPKNSNFTEFNIFRSGSILEVGYCNADNYTDKCEDGLPNIYVSADFKHFIVVTYETATETAYLEYYDTSFNKIWRQEVDKINKQDSNYKGYLDYNENGIILVMDGYLHYISIKDGSEVFSPILIGKDHGVYMLNEKVLLVGIDKKDYIEVMDYNGNMINRIDLKSSNINSIIDSIVQMIDDEIAIITYGEGNEHIVASRYGSTKKYTTYAKIFKLDSSLNLIDESDDIVISE